MRYGLSQPFFYWRLGIFSAFTTGLLACGQAMENLAPAWRFSRGAALIEIISLPGLL